MAVDLTKTAGLLSQNARALYRHANSYALADKEKKYGIEIEAPKGVVSIKGSRNMKHGRCLKNSEGSLQEPTQCTKWVDFAALTEK